MTTNARSGSEDVFRTYLREIGRTPLLKADEEVALAKAMKAMREIDDRGGPTTDEERETVRRGRDAKTRFTRANLRLVVSIAKRYQSLGIPLSDLVQEGNLGLLRAVEKFDVDKGFRFSTYATHWIRQAITAAANEQGRSIRVPVHVHDQIVEAQRVRRELEQKLARQPTYEEIAAEMNIPTERVEELALLALEIISFETPIGQGGESTLSDMVTGGDDVDFGADISRRETAVLLARAMESLTEREREILLFRFGIDDERIHSIDEAAQRFNVTKERVRQIEARAINRLRRSDIAILLRNVDGQDGELD